MLGNCRLRLRDSDARSRNSTQNDPGAIVAACPEGAPAAFAATQKLTAITTMLLNGSPSREVARAFGVGPSAIARHRLRCMGALPSNQIIAQRAAGAMALAVLPTANELGDAYESIRQRADAITTTAEQSGSLAVALAGVREMRSVLDSVGRLAGLVGGSGATVNVQTNVSVDLGAAVRELAAIVGFKPSARALRKLESVADGE